MMTMLFVYAFLVLGVRCAHDGDEIASMEKPVFRHDVRLSETEWRKLCKALNNKQAPFLDDLQWGIEVSCKEVGGSNFLSRDYELKVKYTWQDDFTHFTQTRSVSGPLEVVFQNLKLGDGLGDGKFHLIEDGKFHLKFKFDGESIRDLSVHDIPEDVLRPSGDKMQLCKALNGKQASLLTIEVSCGAVGFSSRDYLLNVYYKSPIAKDRSVSGPLAFVFQNLKLEDGLGLVKDKFSTFDINEEGKFHLKFEFDGWSIQKLSVQEIPEDVLPTVASDQM